MRNQAKKINDTIVCGKTALKTYFIFCYIFDIKIKEI